MGLDGQAKMSKSLDNYIGLTEEPAVIWERLRPAFTDPARKRKSDPGNPLICNIYTLHENFSPQELQEEVAQGCRTAGIGCIDCKKKLFEHMMKVFDPIRERAHDLAQHGDRVDQFLEESARTAKQIAEQTMREVRELMGLR
jgi:tryptophanyl-tRNA synthetase